MIKSFEIFNPVYRKFLIFFSMDVCGKKEQQPSCAKEVIHAYNQLINQDVNAIQPEDIGTTLPIPFFPQQTLMSLCNEAILALSQSEALVCLRAPIYVVGDLHGNIFDLIRILQHANPPPFSRFLFLGDYVDRGHYSIEVITLLLALYLNYPGYIILLRGNHEFPSVNSVYGFKDQVMNVYDSVELYDQFNDVFSYLPIAATINNEIFCVHGGLSPNLKSLNDFDSFPRPLLNYDSSVISDLVWSDPSDGVAEYVQSQRGTGLYFGAVALQNFFAATNMKKIIRAHQCVQLGVQRFHNDDLYTVFSCSNYVESSNNRCGLLFISPNCEVQPFSLPPGFYIERDKALISRYEYRAGGSNRKVQGSMSISLSMQELVFKGSMKGRKCPALRSALTLSHSKGSIPTSGSGVGTSLMSHLTGGQQGSNLQQRAAAGSLPPLMSTLTG
ncbi:Ser/Thr protein phosphatase [Tritrichomonas foetus]|uniref:Serine/threonine-protein phosphatase n=1 Tax=Tritrichomonas foetus TaxID=1144522 RepID=A0A1J4K8L7_9EUKA|nr:Ser/Thr protein phosphatase [Tritrichomonas foetus]|eukprot:OHT07751.1 Ser/Thr protein phosphatase [Tritrichomonas foetus]